jgi:hypothetical protein
MISTIIMGLQLAIAGQNPLAVPVQNVPNLDAARSCRAEAAGSLGAKKDNESCLKTEQAARDQLAKDWTGFATGDRSTCTGQSSIGGQATYTELLTCLEMMRDARKLSKENNMDNATVGSGRR